MAEPEELPEILKSTIGGFQFVKAHGLDKAAIAKAALEAGLDPNQVGPEWLDVAAVRGEIKLVKLLLAHGADVNAGKGMAIRNAAGAGKLKVVQALIDAGADVQAHGDRPSAIHKAADNAKPDVVKLLLEHGAVAVADDLWSACQGRGEKTLETCRALLEGGVDPNGCSGHYPPLTLAAGSGSAELVQLLIDHGAELDYCSNGGTALHEAVIEKRGDTLAVLLAAGADVTIKRPPDDEDELAGMTPLEMARHLKVRKCIPLLEAAESGESVAASPPVPKKPKSAAKAAKPSTVAKSWKRIATCLEEQSPELHKALRQAATEKRLIQLEQKLDIQLPKDLRDSLGIHDGQEHGSPCMIEIDGETVFELLSVKSIAAEWSNWRELIDDGEFADDRSDAEPGIRDDWWNPRWIPFASNGAGDSICVDMAPASGGKRGQIITMNHETSERRLLTESYRVWLAELAGSLEAGEVEVE